DVGHRRPLFFGRERIHGGQKQPGQAKGQQRIAAFPEGLRQFEQVDLVAARWDGMRSVGAHPQFLAVTVLRAGSWFVDGVSRSDSRSAARRSRQMASALI